MLIHRLIRHINGLYRLLRYWPNLVRTKKKFFGCITVDMDAHGHSLAFEKGIPFLLRLYKKMGLEGKVTWFANCRENIFDQNAHLLRRIHEQGYEIGMHSHLDTLCRPHDREIVSKFIELDKRNLEAFLGEKVIGFRSGRFFRTPAILSVLPRLGFLYDSSFTYGKVFRVGDYTMDDSKILGHDSVFAHPNGLLEFPVWEPYPDPVTVGQSNGSYFITTMIHPYNLVIGGKNNIFVQFYYRHLLKLLSKIPDIQFIQLKKALNPWNGNTASRRS